MDIRVSSVRGQGKASEELVVLVARRDCNLNSFAIADNTYGTEGQTTNIHRHCYFFPDWEVEAGDHIFLYTRKGSNRRGETTQKSPASYLYWGSASSIWNDTGDTLHLIQISGSESYTIPAST